MSGARLSLVAALTVGVTAAAGAQSRDSAEAVRVERLAALARVWGVTAFFHPTVAESGAPNWDSAVVETIRTVREARTSAEYREAVSAMLATLSDPLTRVEDTLPAPSVERRFEFRFTADSILILTAGDYYELFAPAVMSRMAEARAALSRARGVVIDLRPAGAVDPFGRLQLEAAFGDLVRDLVTRPLVTPGIRRRVYYGYASATPFSSGQYRTATATENGKLVTPRRGAREIPTVFLIDAQADLPSAAVPLQAAGRAQIVFSGALGTHSVGEAVRIPLGEGLNAQVRIGDPLLEDGTRAWLSPDVTLASAIGPGDRALDTAVAIARHFQPSRVARIRAPAVLAPLPRPDPDMRFPAVEHRLLGAFRVWNVIEHFFPYKQLLDTAWTDVLPRAIREFEAAANAAEYARAVARLSVRLSDAHAYVAGAAYRDAVVDEGYPPIRVRMIEGMPLVTRIFDSAAAHTAGISVGDVVETVDGAPARVRIRELERLISAGTSHSKTDRATLTFMNGPVGSRVRLGLADARGRRREAVLERRREDVTTLYHRERSGQIIRVLPGNVGYVDLDRLTLDMVDSMFAQIAGTRAVIFDMRGYPTGTIWAIAPRLTDSVRVVARLETPMPGHHSPAPGAETFYQTVEPAPRGQRYRGRVLMLMDERSVSQSEHTGLYLKAVSSAVFVGSRTAGTNGEIATVSLPGGLTMGFSGQAVLFPDGRQLQRVGLTPDLEVRPTVRGIRAGRDEVLDAALRHAGSGPAPAGR